MVSSVVHVEAPGDEGPVRRYPRLSLAVAPSLLRELDRVRGEKGYSRNAAVALLIASGLPFFRQVAPRPPRAKRRPPGDPPAVAPILGSEGGEAE
jgi:hypothetical protein